MIFGTLDASVFVNNLFSARPVLDLNHQDSTTLLYETSTFRPRATGVTVTYRFRLGARVFRPAFAGA